MTPIDILLDTLASSRSTWKEKLEAADAIAANSGNCHLGELLELLRSHSAPTRNAAAIALRQIGDNRAVEPLFAAIQTPANLQDRSTLVYALEHLNCSGHFQDVFLLVLSDKADVRLAAANIFFSQGFFVDEEDLTKARQLLKASLVEHHLLGAIEDRLNELE